MFVVNRWIGICFILAGVFIGSFNYVEWQVGRSAAKKMTKEEIKQYKEGNEQVQAQYPESNIIEQKPSSEVHHIQGEKVAMLVVPTVGQKFSVYWGADQKVLKKGVGMYVSPLTTTPNGGGHTVLSGHRDTVFYRLDELKENEILKLEYAGSLFTYKIKKIWITDPQDRTVIVEKEAPTLTITTCYPFNYVGNAPKRYIIEADLLYKEESGKTVLKGNINWDYNGTSAS
ncbi:class D sortase [Neobacillus mesonae]|uniref:class D sortase n=1 Tax=Neobacillus mesonae TaxID=1193713 RepID=UPI0025748C0F|nr:class D sortase [Neobacillus mesonae]MED4205453.1 class D sortase [Neobacillus mesonae]